ncbi:hypothetical protein GS399_05890 [Pedobacter sp. HMF7647]|uniref:DUF3108 domain-containing protein n=1 Tax=Hufsiella arboris TaxID=2695275 RepID=A0A7K1Y8Y3_9SPHI|nr:DUF6134 family protein [Hufsiella arboris]MXV50498.1 hypothetical protein [Hufsiella arboris]
MIPAMLFCILRRYLSDKKVDRNFIAETFTQLKTSIKPVLIAILFIAASASVCANEQTLNYSVLHNGKVVGSMQLYQKRSGENLYLRIHSDVKMRLIVGIHVQLEEESFYKYGKLINSRLCRKVNGDEKANRQTIASGNNYKTIAEGRSGIMSTPNIDTNLIMLYVNEPGLTTKVYSDNFQKFLNIRKVKTHCYRIDLPDGNYNDYTYTNGICSKIDIHHTLYTIQVQLT